MTLKNHKFVCKNCNKNYFYQKSFEKHVLLCKKVTSNSITLQKKKIVTPPTDIISLGGIFSFSDDYWEETPLIFNVLSDNLLYQNHLEEFQKKNQKNLNILHLNINSIFSKVDSFFEILDLNIYDILFINESKLNSLIPDSHICHPKYNHYRRDRDYPTILDDERKKFAWESLLI